MACQRKEVPKKELYIYNLPYNELIINSGLDRLELGFEGFNFSEFGNNTGHHGTIILYFGGKGYPFIFMVSKYRGYQYCVDIKYDYKGYKFEAIKIIIGNKTPNTTLMNKVIVEGKFFRFSKLNDFKFTTRDILDFLNTHFVGLRVLTFDYCIDIEIAPEIDNDFLSTVYVEACRLRTTKKTHFKPIVPFGRTESIYDGNIKYKENDTIYGRYYDKKIDIIDKKTKPLYLDYLQNKNNIYRFELEFRRASTANISFLDLYDGSYLLNIFLTKLESKGILIFKNSLDHKKVLIKREVKEENTLKGGALYKLDTLGKINHAKGVIAQLDKMEKAGIDIMKMKEEHQILNLGIAQEYTMYYVGMLDSITEFFIGTKEVLYLDFKKEIEGHIEYIEATCGVPYSSFLSCVKGYVDGNLQEMYLNLSRPILLLIDSYFIEKTFPPDDKTFEFLKVFKESSTISFLLEDIKPKIRQIKKTKSFQIVFQQNTKQDQQVGMNIVHFISNHI